jgi:putative ABC transport system permease protein
MESLLQDVRFGTRILLRTPVITGSIVLILALGIGTNSAMFGVVDGLLLHPVSYPNPETLVFVWNYDGQGVLNYSSAANFLDWRAQAKSISDFAAWVQTSFVVTGSDRPRQVAGAGVTANFFRTLGVQPALGRTFLPDEDGLDRPADAAHAAVISYRLWQEELGADPYVLGRTIRVDSVPYAVVGVMPADFQFRWRPQDIWVPISLNVHDRDYHDLLVIARLREPRARAAAEMAVIARSLEAAYPKSNAGWTIQVEDFREQLLNRTFRQRLLLLFGAVGLVLLIACTNVASLLLARSAAREREIAVRISLGATGTRLARQLLTESALLSLAGGGLGLALAWALIRVAPKIVPANAIPGGPILLSVPVLWFALAISVLTSLLFGLAPALAAARPDLHTALKDASRSSTAGRGRQRFRQTMVAAEVAAALMLLASAGLMVESVRDLTHADPGFDPRNVLTLRLFLPTAKYDAAQALRFHRLALERLAALPGVKNATVGSSLPHLNNFEVAFDREGSPPRAPAERPGVAYATVDAEYFRTFGISLKSGRFFTEADNENAPLVAIVNEALVARYFPDENPIGKRLLVDRPLRGQNGFEQTRRLEIVGVVGNVKLSNLSREQKPLIYAPHPQNAWSAAVWFAVRTEVNPAALASAVRSEVMSIDRDQPVEQVGSLEQMLTDQFVQPRFQTGLMGFFALFALILAALGIYGVNAYAVAQRRHEIGLRMALGASPGGVLREILGQGMLSTAIGIGLGLAGAVALSALLKSVLVGTSGTDPVTLLGMTLLLAAVATVACYLPARKATRIDPAVVLKAE